jgi:hypothetical protein
MYTLILRSGDILLVAVKMTKLDVAISLPLPVSRKLSYPSVGLEMYSLPTD